jgi:hypothetical protein
MNPWSLAPPVLVAVGNGGNEEVSVVARRVGLKRREDACAVGINDWNIKRSSHCMYFALPNQAVVTQVLEHRPLRIAKTLCRIFLMKSSINWTSQKSAERESLLVQAPLSIT